MCFSAEVSFAASAVLGLTGVATLKSAALRSYMWLALVPLLFAFQQFNEGILWLNMPLTDASPWYAFTAEKIFMIFAYLFWPVYIPFALFMAESNEKKQITIGITLLAGIAMVTVFVWNYLTWDGTAVDVSVVGQSLHYSANDPKWRAVYIIIILLPCFVSSLRWIKLFGILIALSILATELFFATAFVSVWCFFAAIISLVLFFILRINRPVRF